MQTTKPPTWKSLLKAEQPLLLLPCAHDALSARLIERAGFSAYSIGGFGLGGAESYPGVFGAFGGFADDAKLDGGYLALSERPGIGFEGQSALYAIMRKLGA